MVAVSSLFAGSPFRYRRGALASLLLASISVGRASAQTRPATAVIDGVVTDTTLTPLAEATAAILGTRVRVVTGANGHFRIVSLRAGRYIVVVNRLGYAPASLTVQVTEGDTLRPAFALEPVAATLDPVNVAAMPRRLGRLEEFEDRRRFGFGQFMTRAEIEKRNALFVADLLRTFQGVAIGKPSMNSRAGCPFQFFINGVAIPSPKLEEDLPTPKDLAGIEVFTSAGTIPPQYKTYSGRGGFCGVILLWTK